MKEPKTPAAVCCYHCGQDCGDHPLHVHEKDFCCQGCIAVYEILNQSGMCDYYTLTHTPGTSQKIKVRPDKFRFLDEAGIHDSLISYCDNTQTHITFYLPQIHCSSCLWLLENLHRLNGHILSSRVNFSRKEVSVVFTHDQVSLRGVAELLTSIGYEPYISLQQLSKRKRFFDRSKVFKLGVAGFCFANIMLFSFPEYLGIDANEQNLVGVFRHLNFALSLPVLLFSASEFYISAWKSLKHGVLNIDAPIVLATLVTVGRSVYEMATGTGGGYFDSMTGIIFFMLIGRILQQRTYEQLDFERDYTSYFPVAVTRIADHTEQIITLPDIRLNDTLLLHSQELIPADGILTKGRAVIDYSFVTGESVPVVKEMGEIVYAGGKQLEANIELLVIKEVNQSYLTRLWNNHRSAEKNMQRSFVNLLSRYFTLILFFIAALAVTYWSVHDAARIWNVLTAILIVACPCALLLSNTFTNGNILRILGNNGFYLKNAQVIEDIAQTDHIVFDKTGTLTISRQPDIEYEGKPLIPSVRYRVASLASQSIHPVSRSIAAWIGGEGRMAVQAYKEIPGKGIEGFVGNDLVSLGSAGFVHAEPVSDPAKSAVFLSIEGQLWGVFHLKNRYRDHIPDLLQTLKGKYGITILSGDNAAERPYLQKMLGQETEMLFNQGPEQKMNYIRALQQQGKKVMMVGDGLNDAGALQQADAGIAVSDSHNNFTPASDGIIQAEQLPLMNRFIRLCHANRKVVLIAFVVSILYNIVGLFFAVQGALSPMIAAILMPASSLSILLISFGTSNLIAAKWKLVRNTKN
ncbi:heavy metal translocating P-type ATPase [Sediminibacterium soli]|uniref:heavy metal translocating P-type ATPase n=1 Tax=Sediminibacterium soli TaxID=2698829 RepID=UPI00137AA69F|nr:heavy metal translocating P-type ATPase metal-binding domain-containing protein [Sediminibacterium soli]NCI45677.1 HAD-IC family P-type ATPase [Sediminibacterium soli]